VAGGAGGGSWRVCWFRRGEGCEEVSYPCTGRSRKCIFDRRGAKKVVFNSCARKRKERPFYIVVFMTENC